MNADFALTSWQKYAAAFFRLLVEAHLHIKALKVGFG